MNSLRFALVWAAVAVFSDAANSQIAIVHNGRGQTRSTEFRISSVEINADINEQVATVQIAQTFENIGGRTLETQFLFPMPEGAAVNALTLIVDGKELPGELKPKAEARREYEAIVRRQQDPALLEYMGRGLFKTSVFPIPAGQKRRVEIRYTQLLKSDSGLVDFTLPLGTTKHSEKAVEEVNVAVRIKSTDEIRNVYSPTHEFDIDRSGDNRATCRLSLRNVREPNDIRLLYGTKGNEVGINLVSFKPDGDEQGYFLVLATPKMKVKKDEMIPKTVVFVVDRSGSMSGEKLKQAKASLHYMINSLGPKDTFNIISYSSEVDMFQPELELVTDKTRRDALDYAEDIYAGGGTNINAALTAALDQLKDNERPGYVMFMTDGLPTVGVTGETEIAANARKANKVNARVFSFGVGYDVNSRLLDRLSRDQRGTSVYVKPEEDIEVASTNLFRKVSSPAMTSVKLRFVNESGSESGRLVNRTYPSDLPDLFRGEQLIVVGRYREAMPVTIDLTGKVAGKSRTLTFDTQFGNSEQTRRNSFVETLWATRRIGEIIDDLDLNGQNQELIDELVGLSLKHGIMTPYTSFLADENVSFGDRRRLMTEARQRTEDGLSVAGGFGGFVQREFKKQLQNARRGASASFGSESADFDAADSGGVAGGGRPQSNLSKAEGIAQLFGPRYHTSPTSRAAGRANQPATGPAATPRPDGASPVESATIRSGFDAAAGSAAEGEEKSSGSGGQKAKNPAQRIKRIGAKTFYWKSGEWQDSAVSVNDATDAEEKDVVTVKQFSDEYFELTKLDNGRFASYLTLSEPVLVKIKDKVYRIVPPETKKN